MKKPSNKRLLIAAGSVVGLVLVAAGVVALGSGVFDKEPDTASDVGENVKQTRVIKRSLPGFVGQLELRGFANPLSDAEKEALRNDVIAQAKAKGLWDAEHPVTMAGGDGMDAGVFVAYGYVVGPDGVPDSLAESVAEEGYPDPYQQLLVVAEAHHRARLWFEERQFQSEEHLYNRESITRVVPGVFAGRLELRPLADPLSAAEKEALRNDVIARAKAEGFWSVERPDQDSRRLPGEHSFDFERKLGPIHIAYGYVVDSEGKPWKYEVSVNNEKEAAGVHQKARDWLHMFETQEWLDMLIDKERYGRLY